MNACSGNCNQGRSCHCVGSDVGHSERQAFLHEGDAALGIWNGLKYSAVFWLALIALLMIW